MFFFRAALLSLNRDWLTGSWGAAPQGKDCSSELPIDRDVPFRKQLESDECSFDSLVQLVDFGGDNEKLGRLSNSINGIFMDRRDTFFFHLSKDILSVSIV